MISHMLRRRRWQAAIIAFMLFASSLGAIPAHAQDMRCFPEAGLFDASGNLPCISGRIREFWEQNGGLQVFGYPLDQQHGDLVEGRTVQLQHFERNRLELHPENARPYDVLLGRLGAENAGSFYVSTLPEDQPLPGCHWFAQTRHNVCDKFKTFWEANGLEFDGRSGKSEDESLALFGLPLTSLVSINIGGRNYSVQFFERARFEYHNENAPPYDVLLGLLGK